MVVVVGASVVVVGIGGSFNVRGTLLLVVEVVVLELVVVDGTVRSTFSGDGSTVTSVKAGAVGSVFTLPRITIATQQNIRKIATAALAMKGNRSRLSGMGTYGGWFVGYFFSGMNCPFIRQSARFILWQNRSEVKKNLKNSQNTQHVQNVVKKRTSAATLTV